MSDPSVSVYFVQAGEAGPIKIGFSNDVRKRIALMQTGCPDRLRLLLEMKYDTEEQARDMEATWHGAFADVRIGKSEWFRPHRDIIDLCSKLSEVTKLRGDFVLLFDVVRSDDGIALRPARPV